MLHWFQQKQRSLCSFKVLNVILIQRGNRDGLYPFNCSIAMNNWMKYKNVLHGKAKNQSILIRESSIYDEI